MYNYKNTILDVFNIYKWENHVLKKNFYYKKYGLFKDLSLIKKEYKDYLATNNLPIKDDNNESDDSDFYIK